MAQPSPFGQTLADAIGALERRGYRASFRTEAGGSVVCLTCGRAQHADAYPMLEFERVEGLSDPSDENIVAGIQCPTCGQRGTLVLPYGALSTRTDSHVLAHMHPDGSVEH